MLALKIKDFLLAMTQGFVCREKPALAGDEAVRELSVSVKTLNFPDRLAPAPVKANFAQNLKYRKSQVKFRNNKKTDILRKIGK